MRSTRRESECRLLSSGFIELVEGDFINLVIDESLADMKISTKYEQISDGCKKNRKEISRLIQKINLANIRYDAIREDFQRMEDNQK